MTNEQLDAIFSFLGHPFSLFLIALLVGMVVADAIHRGRG